MPYDGGKGKRMIDLEWSDGNIYDYFEKMGFFFPKEILARYYLSLKTKPFVILTGISGTGKTKIAQIFADYICQDDTPEERKKRIAFISVRPDWMDNKGLLGYYNLLDEKYHATPVLRLLLEAEKNPHKPYFVILDEMNLAKVEQYFSDFLSIMESRTSSNPTGESLDLHSMRLVKTHDDLPIPGRINMPPNIYFTGTVNVDESTYMFSPKVLDRANVIEFNNINLRDYAAGSSQFERLTLKETDLRQRLSAGSSDPFCSREDYERALKIMGKDGLVFQELLDVLSPYNLHFGYRVVNEISRFVSNAHESVDDFSVDDMVDIQILQKILPKFHGSQAKLEDPLRQLLANCYGNGCVFDESLLKENATNDAGQNKHVRFPRSAAKLSRMIRNLRVQGYTSFIE